MIGVLQEYALMAEIISAIAIVISLIFVGFQIKENTKATQASAFHDIATLDVNLLLSMANSQESAKISTLFRENPDALSEDELNYGFYIFAAEVRHVENLFLQKESKMISERSWRSREALVEGLVLSPGFGAFLGGTNKKYFDGSFIEYAERKRASVQSVSNESKNERSS
ncbi:MAG: hypothetical protein V2I38_06010 [Alcanivoracaceae bacterium]|jgi:hypothetical protein|nr:hypothetical protein [Alcanivoracaceae bacterium]